MANLPIIRIGTRKSPLALTQARIVRDRLIAAWPGLQVELVEIVTSGDTFTDRPLMDIGGKGLFTKEIEEGLLANTVDIAVHSMKDMQTVLPEKLIIGCMLEREDPSDMLVGHGLTSIDDIPQGASFGTSSLRRSAQMLMRRPDLKIVPLRGNVETRLAKIERGEMVATMLAVAGLKRLGLTNPLPLREGVGGGVLSVSSKACGAPPSLTLPLKGGGEITGAVIPCTEFLPAVAQGAIGIECRENDTKIHDLLKPLSHTVTEQAVTCERAFLRALDGSCRTPIAGYAKIENGTLKFSGMIIKPDGSTNHSTTAQGIAQDAEAIGLEAGKQLLGKAGKNFLL